MPSSAPTTERSAVTRRRDQLTPTRWRAQLGRILVLSDALVIALASMLAYLFRQRLGETGVVGQLQNEVPVALAVLPLWLLILYAFGCYQPEYQNQTGESVRRFFGGVVGGVVLLGFVSFVFRLELARLYVLFLFVLVLIGGLGVRAGIKRWLRRRRARGELIQRVLAVGADEEETLEVVRAMHLDSGAGYQVVGFIDEQLAPGTEVEDGWEVLGGIADLLEVAARKGVGLVVVSPAATSPGTLQDIIIELEGSLVDLAVAPSLFQVVARRLTVETVSNVPLLHVDQVRLSRGKAFVKRTLDLVVGVALGLVALPVMAAATVAVRVDSPGPVLFRQRRVGKDGEEFTLYKFRTMVDDADDLLRDVEHLNEVGHGFFKVREDPRVTSAGAVLRKWSIDELPQLYNVLRGDMSMVGPRPPLPTEVEDYEPWQLRRLRVRPGITGVWQVSGRSTVPFEEAVRMDLFYIQNWSLGFDLYLLAKTVPAVLGRAGAY